MIRATTPSLFVVDPAGPENVIVAKSLAVQKSAAIEGGGTAASPQDVIVWSVRAQVSDFFDLDALTLSDVLSDGQRFDPSFVPTLQIQEQGVVTSVGAFSAANFTAVRPGATTNLSFRVGDEMVSRGFDSLLEGGGGDGPAPTEIIIVFHSIVDPTYSTGQPVDHDDAVSNAAVAQATIEPSGNPITDPTTAQVPISVGQLDEKTVYAINGDLTVPASPLVTSGDVITFRLRYTVPTGETHSLALTDFLPLPIFTSAGITFQDRVDPAAPPAGVAWFGPTDTLDATAPIGYPGAPTVTIDAASNSVAFEYGDFFVARPSGPQQIDILFSVAVQDRPFGDGLLFNNIVQATELNSTEEATIGLGTADVVLSQPELALQKGIVASTNPDAVFAPTPVAPVAFTPPGSAGVRFSGTLSSNALAAGEIDSNVSQVDAGDLATFAIVIENSGSGRNGAFDIIVRDTLPAGFAIPTGGAGLNLQVTDGAGNPLAFTGDLFTTGISIVDGTAAGALAPANATSGQNVLVITYDVRLIDTVATPNEIISNLASIDHYAAFEGGADFAFNLLPEDRTGSASATTAGPEMIKVVSSTSLPESSGSTLLIGEEVFYDVTLTLAEGSTAGLVFTDTLPNTAGGRIAFLDATLLSVGGNISFANTSLVPGTALAGIDSNGDGILDQVTASFGDTINLPNNVVNAGDQIVVRIHGVVPDIPENNSGDVLTNTAVATFIDGQGNPGSIEATAPITIGVPGPTITKTVVGATTVDAEDLVEYQVVVTNPIVGGVAVPVFDLLVGDELSDPGLALVTGSVTATGAAQAAAILSGNTAGQTVVLVGLPALQPGEFLTLRYQARVATDAIAGDVLRNTAVQRSDTIPGDAPEQREFISSDNAEVNVAVPAVTKVVTSTDLADTGTSQGNPALEDLAFGETVTYTLTVTMPEGVTQDAILRDLTPVGSGLEIVSATIASVGANLTIGNGAGVGTTATLADRNGDNLNDIAALPLDDVTNVPDGVSNAADQITMTIVSRLVSVPTTSPGAVLSNQGQLGFTAPTGPSTISAEASIEVVAPRFALTKTPDSAECRCRRRDPLHGGADQPVRTLRGPRLRHRPQRFDPRSEPCARSRKRHRHELGKLDDPVRQWRRRHTGQRRDR